MTRFGVEEVFLLKISRITMAFRLRPVDDSPDLIPVTDSQLMAPWRNVGHGSRVRHRQPFSALKPPQEETGLHTSFARERRSLYLPTEPCERLLHFRLKYMSEMTYTQEPR
jgi:hypothetical protein